MLYYLHDKGGGVMNYIDTLSIYAVFNGGSITLNHTAAQWRHFKKPDQNASHYFIRYKNLTCRFFPSRYGYNWVCVTFSIGKLLRGTNLRPLDIEDKELYQRVSEILMEIISLPNYDIATWQVSRLDLFILHAIPPGRREDYERAYQRLSLGSFIPYQYKSTAYLFSRLKRYKAANTTIRIYPKLAEIADKEYPSIIDKDVELYAELFDKLEDYMRLEFAFRRPTLRRYFNGNGVAVADVMNENFQKERINRMIQRLHLDLTIITRTHMRNAIKLIFSKKPTQQRAARYISMVNSRGAYPKTVKANFTEGEVRYIQQKLRQYGIHTVLTDGIDNLEPVQLLK